MRVGIFGSRDWTDYPDLMRNITVFIQESFELDHDNIVFVHAGNKGAENMVTEYVGKTESFLRQKKFKIKEELFRNPATIINDIGIIESGIDYAIVFSTGCKRTISCSKLLKEYEIPFRVIESA